MVKDAKQYRVRLRCAVPTTEENLEGITEEVKQKEAQEYQCEWEGAWGEGRTLQLPQLNITSKRINSV
jgi:hypothetical protein